jgi:ankyrin repeat protein
MQNHILRRAALLAVLVVMAAGFSPIAHAQIGGPGGPLDSGQMLHQGAAMAKDMAKPEVAPPPALPGAASRADSVAPATQIPMDMSPNDALFDAINRGDIAAARDALSRGADLSAQNVLGMTPMELSVDLGRNDISFLLLSYRDNSSSPAAPDLAQVKATTPAKTAAAKSASRKSVVPVVAAMPAAPQTPQLFANDGGSPVPSAGFLGFDAGHSAH